jgi:[acyl-carrier-protein] S-malonyltransferase
MAAIQSERPGTMGAIIGLSAERVGELCRDRARRRQRLAGEPQHACHRRSSRARRSAVVKLLELAEPTAGERAIRLQVGGGVSQRADGARAERPGGDDAGPSVAGSASRRWSQTRPRRWYDSASGVREALVAQIASPVLWVDCVRTLDRTRASHRFSSSAPGRVLSGLVSQVEPEAETFAADSPKKLAKFLERKPTPDGLA